MAHSKQNFTLKNGDPETGISLCIPRVFNNIGWRRIKQIFIDLQWGFVERVDVIPRGEHKRAFVHFAPGKWRLKDRQAMDVLAALKAGGEVKIVYDEPWYWKISLSRAKKPDEAPKPKPRPVVQLPCEKQTATPTPAEKKETMAPVVIPGGKKVKISRRAAVAAMAGGTNDA